MYDIFKFFKVKIVKICFVIDRKLLVIVYVFEFFIYGFVIGGYFIYL